GRASEATVGLACFAARACGKHIGECANLGVGTRDALEHVLRGLSHTNCSGRERRRGIGKTAGFRIKHGQWRQLLSASAITRSATDVGQSKSHPGNTYPLKEYIRVRAGVHEQAVVRLRQGFACTSQRS